MYFKEFGCKGKKDFSNKQKIMRFFSLLGLFLLGRAINGGFLDRWRRL
jgi:hypothetical protein